MNYVPKDLASKEKLTSSAAPSPPDTTTTMLGIKQETGWGAPGDNECENRTHSFLEVNTSPHKLTLVVIFWNGTLPNLKSSLKTSGQ
jgi:hypothetical protein